MSDAEKLTEINRRTFLSSTMATGAGLVLTPVVWGQNDEKSPGEINIAMIGVGGQGRILLDHILGRIPGIRVKAVCDIWSYSQRIGGGMCRKSKQTANVYEDYREMLDKEKDLDAAVIAIPDFVHHEVANACLQAGLHVYCEKEMSNDIEKARSMVQTARQTGKLLQIGHQRRSNPYYKHAYNLIHKEKFFGALHTVHGQWNQLKPLRPLSKKLASKYPLTEDKLEKYGYRTMAEFRNWRWFEKYAGGPMTDLGSHQVDIFNWYLQAPPSAVTAIGGREHARAEAKASDVGYTPECFDCTHALYEWKTQEGIARGYYQVNLNTSHGGFYEVFMGKKGSMTISEITSKNFFFRERTTEATEWEDDAEKLDTGGEQAMTFDPTKSRREKGKMNQETLDIEADMKKPAHQPHLENFFAAVRGKAELTCPAEEAFETCVAVIKANESALSGKRIELKPEDFKA